MPSELLSERDGTTLVLTMSGPGARNALSAQLLSAGIEALDTADGDDGIAAVVLTGADGHFCAGGHLAGLAQRRQDGPPAQTAMIELLHQWIETLRASRKPVIAAVEGAAAGAGFSIALACDLIVAAESACFALSHARLGLSPDGGATWELARALPRQAAQRLVWLGEPVTARQLHDWGVVGELCADGQARRTALDLAARLAALAPQAIASGKALLEEAPGHSLRAQLDAERDHFIRNLFHPDGGEGLQAALAKRPPRFSRSPR